MLQKSNGILTFILAGGKGSRLYPLTRDRTKPGVPFAGRYRIIDFVLSSCINSGLRQIFLLTQTKSHSLDNHLRNGWNFLNHELKEFIASVPAQQRINEEWYRGTADAIFQNLNLLEDYRPEHVLILSGDHIYNMDFTEIYNEHMASGADLTVSVKTIKKSEASEFGVLAMTPEKKITTFIEKPQDPSIIPGDGENCYINMGIYLFKTDSLVKALAKDARTENSVNDFGKNVIPDMLKNNKVQGFIFEDSRFGNYWRDVGTIKSFYDANMDFLSQLGDSSICTPEWRIRTMGEQLPPSYFGGVENVTLDNTIVGTGSHIKNSKIVNSIIGRNCKIAEGCEIRDSVIMNDSTIGSNCKISKAILDHRVKVAPDTTIGLDLEEDKSRFVVSEGISVLPKGFRL